MQAGDGHAAPPTRQAGDGHAAPLAQEKGMGAELPTPSIISRVPDCHTYEGLEVGVTTS
jgi:hypothetical protein